MKIEVPLMTLDVNTDPEGHDNLVRIMGLWALARATGISVEAIASAFVEALAQSDCEPLFMTELISGHGLSLANVDLPDMAGRPAQTEADNPG